MANNNRDTQPTCVSWSLLTVLLIGPVQSVPLQLPAPLAPDAALTAPSYMPLSTPAAAIPALSNWREVNQRVSDIGGWMFYAAEGETDHSQHQTEQLTPQPKSNADHHEGHPL